MAVLQLIQTLFGIEELYYISSGKTSGNGPKPEPDSRAEARKLPDAPVLHTQPKVNDERVREPEIYRLFFQKE